MALVSYAVVGDRAVWGGRSLRAWADELVAVIVAEFVPCKVVLFGSVADGSDGPDSDIDVLVIFDVLPLADRRPMMVKLRNATRGIAAPHDVLVTDVADYVRNSSVPGTVEFEAATRGVPVFERHG